MPHLTALNIWSSRICSHIVALKKAVSFSRSVKFKLSE